MNQPENVDKNIKKDNFTVSGMRLLTLTGLTKDALSFAKETLADPARSTLALLNNAKNGQVSLLAIQAGDDEQVQDAGSAIRKLDMNDAQIKDFFGQQGFTPIYGVSNLKDEGAWIVTGNNTDADAQINVETANELYETFLEGIDLTEVAFYGPSGQRNEYVWALTSDDTFKQLANPFDDATSIRHTVVNGQLIVAVAEGGSVLKMVTADKLLETAWADKQDTNVQVYTQQHDIRTPVRDLSIGRQIQMEEPAARYRILATTTQDGILPVELTFDGNDLIAAMEPGNAVQVDENVFGSPIRHTDDQAVFFGKNEISFVPNTKLTSGYNSLRGIDQQADAK